MELNLISTVGEIRFEAYPIQYGNVDSHVVYFITKVDSFGSIDKDHIVETFYVIGITTLKIY